MKDDPWDRLPACQKAKTSFVLSGPTGWKPIPRTFPTGLLLTLRVTFSMDCFSGHLLRKAGRFGFSLAIPALPSRQT